MEEWQKNLLILIFFILIVPDKCESSSKLTVEISDQTKDENQQLLELISNKILKLSLTGLLEDYFEKMYILASNKIIQFDPFMIKSAIIQVKYGASNLTALQEVKTKVLEMIKQNEEIRKHNILSKHMITKYDAIVQYLTVKLDYLKTVIANHKTKNDYEEEGELDLTYYLLHLFEDMKRNKNTVCSEIIKEFLLNNLKNQRRHWDKTRVKRNLNYSFANSDYMKPNPGLYAYVANFKSKKPFKKTKLKHISITKNIKNTKKPNNKHCLTSNESKLHKKDFVSVPSVSSFTPYSDLTVINSPTSINPLNQNRKLWVCTNDNNLRTITSTDNILIPITLNKVFNDYFVYYTKSMSKRQKNMFMEGTSNIRCKIYENHVLNIDDSVFNQLIHTINVVKNKYNE